jgi:hypothetical protein
MGVSAFRRRGRKFGAFIRPSSAIPMKRRKIPMRRTTAIGTRLKGCQKIPPDLS